MSVPVSVVIPCYNCADTIERAVQSVYLQTVMPSELILVDDASCDDRKTYTVLQSLQKRYSYDFPVQLISLERNEGPGAARNRAWEMASQPYLAFLDADDAWHPRKLEIQVQWMEVHAEAAMTGTQSLCIQRDQNAPRVSDSCHAKEISFTQMLFSNHLVTRSVVIRTAVPHRFVPGKRYSEDYLLWLSAMADGYRTFLLQAPLAYSFKPDFGAAGLSAHLWTFHREVLDTYQRLYQAGHISGCMRAVLGSYEFLKFLRRAALST